MNLDMQQGKALHRLALQANESRKDLARVVFRRHQLEDEISDLEQQERELMADICALEGAMFRAIAAKEAMPTGYEQALEVEAHG